MAINTSMLSVTLLHFASIVKKVGFTFPMLDFFKVGLALIATGFLMNPLFYELNRRVDQGWALIGALLIGSAFYIGVLVTVKVLGQQDVERIPWIGKQIAPLFPKR